VRVKVETCLLSCKNVNKLDIKSICIMPDSKTILKEIAKQLRDRREIDVLRRFLARHGKRLMVARLYVEDGHLQYRGTVGQIVSYKWRDINCVKTKGSLNKKKFRRSKCFEGSRRSAKRFAKGNELASNIYWKVFVSRKTYPLFLFLKKRAVLLIKEGKTLEEAENILTDYLQSFGLIRKERRAKNEEQREGGSAEREGRGNATSKTASKFNFDFKSLIWQPGTTKVPNKRFAAEIIQDDS
jgi:hypothetical protein